MSRTEITTQPRADGTGLRRARRLTAAVRNCAQANARNRRESREDQAPVFARLSCETPRRDWGSGGLRHLFFAKCLARRIFEPRRNCRSLRAAHAAQNRRGSHGVVTRGDLAGMRRGKEQGFSRARLCPAWREQALELLGFSGDARRENFLRGHRCETVNQRRSIARCP